MTNIIKEILDGIKTNFPKLAVFNLVNGYEIIGEVHDMSDGFYHLRKALLFSMRQTPENKITVDLISPVTFGEPDIDGYYNIPIGISAIATVYPPTQECFSAYKQKLSPIILASSLK